MCSTGSITPENKGGGVRPLMEDFHKKAAFFSMKASPSHYTTLHYSTIDYTTLHEYQAKSPLYMNTRLKAQSNIKYIHKHNNFFCQKYVLNQKLEQKMFFK